MTYRSRDLSTSRTMPGSAEVPADDAHALRQGAVMPPREGDLMPVFDRDGLVRRMGGAEFVEIFVEKYCATTAKLLFSLHQALDGVDYPEVHLRAHSIKGAAASIGAEAMREVALRMEQAAQKPEERQTLSLLLLDLEDAFAEFRSVASPPTR